jgi:hypothetical protein
VPVNVTRLLEDIKNGLPCDDVARLDRMRDQVRLLDGRDLTEEMADELTGWMASLRQTIESCVVDHGSISQRSIEPALSLCREMNDFEDRVWDELPPACT